MILKSHQNTTNSSHIGFASIGRTLAERPTPRISTRKSPRQSRSTELVATILEAAVRVLTEEGAARFTTARVAERAGASVGSLYQYFPNKASILFRLQSDEWRRTHTLLRSILVDQARLPLDRLRALVHAFVRSECEEAAVRTALADAAPLYRGAPEAIEARQEAEPLLDAFMLEVLPDATAERRDLIGELILSAMTAVAKRFSETPRTEAEVDRYAEAMADMFTAYLDQARAAG